MALGFVELLILIAAMVGVVYLLYRVFRLWQKQRSVLIGRLRDKDRREQRARVPPSHAA